MQKRRLSVKLISLLLTLSFLISAFSVFAFAEVSDTDDTTAEMNVVYNRTFSEGWDYDNGILTSFAKGNQIGLGYEYRNSAYNYFLKVVKQNTDVAYAHINTTGLLPTDGKTFVEFDIASSLNNAMGQAIRLSVQGDVKTLVEFKDDGMYILGTNVERADYAMKWESVSFEIDFDYGQNTDGASADEYLITAYFNNEKLTSKVYSTGFGGFGVTQLRFCFGNVVEANIDSWYAIDNLQIYSGVDTFTAITGGTYGSAIDSELSRDYVLASDVAHPDGYIRGEYDIQRQEADSRLLTVYYNRSFGEGWTLDQASSTAYLKYATVDARGNNVDIRSEKDADGNYNYFMRYRALNTASSGYSVKIPECPDDELIYIEFDLKTGVNTDLGGIVKLAGSSDFWLLSIEDGQLLICGKPVGYIGSDWTHIAAVMDPEELTMTVYYGDTGVYTGELPMLFDTVTFGQQGGTKYDSFGDWFAVDNLQIYSGVFAFTTLDPEDYGLAIDTSATYDFVLEDATLPDTPVSPDGPSDSSSSSNSASAPSGVDEVISGAPDLERVELDEFSRVQYNRHYGEGWAFEVGGGIHSGAIMQLQSEQNVDLTYNYYQYYEVIANGGNAYWNFSGSGMPTSGKIFLEMDLKASEGANFGGIWQMRPLGGSNYYILGFTDGYLTGYNGAKLGKVSEDQWVHVAIEFDFDYAKNNPTASSENVFLISYYYGEDKFAAFEHDCGGTFGLSSSAFRVGFASQTVANAGAYWCMDNLQFYAGTSTFANIPESNYGLLVNTSTAKDFPIQSSGTTIDDMIADSLFMKLNSEYTLADNVRQPALENADGEAYGAPVKINGKVWVPIDTILNYLSYPIYITEDEQSFAISTGTSITYITLGRDTAVVGGEKIVLDEAPAVITDDDGNEFLAATVDDLALLFPEFYIKIDDMNLITFTEHSALGTGSITESIRVDIMKDFLFDYIAAEDVYEMAKEATNNFDHPYIIANQEKFDELAETYRLGQLNKDSNIFNDVEGVDMTLYSYINSIVTAAKCAYIDYAAGYNRTGGYGEWITLFDTGLSYEGLKAQCYIYDSETSSLGLLHPWPNSNGYDPSGGRLSVNYSGASGSSGSISDLGYAYQVTKDLRYAALAYDWASMLVDWDHWGPGHFLNAADAGAAVSTTYDWCYDAWVELGLDVDKIADGIYYHCALQGYLISIGSGDAHGRSAGVASRYVNMVNNWNAVCTAGVASAAFSVLDYTGFTAENSKLASAYARSKADEWGGEKMTEVMTSVISMNFKSLVNTGLEIYAPDGSYEESVSYWAYGANNLFRYSAILKSCLGTDLGLMDTWGLDRTAYSIAQMVSSDYEAFSYNDTSVGGACNSGWFNYLAEAVNDDALRVLRKMHIEEGGLDISRVDSLFYEAVAEGATVELPLQYHHVGIHGYTVRSSWDRGAIYAGLLGGDNDDGHGHIDAGQWIYYSDGVSWIQDIGADGYNTYKYFSNDHMYKTNPEGHNVIVLTSMQDKIPAGQLRSSVSPVLEVYDNEYGAYTIVDTLPAFSSAAMLSCERGMLFTNDRKTVVIQDEITPLGNQTMYWFAHYNVKTISAVPSVITDVEISSNGRTAFLYAKSPITGDTVCLRMSIVSPLSKGITFGVMTAADEQHPEDFVLDATQRYGYSESMGKERESDRSMWNKLFIKFENLYNINVAVVLEVIDEEDPLPIGYSWTPMYQWEPYADTRVKSDGESESSVIEESIRSTAKQSDVPQYASKLEKRLEDGILFEDINYYYKAITNMNYIVDKLGRDRFSSGSYAESLVLYDKFNALYQSYYDSVTATSAHIKGIRAALLGAKSETAPEDT